MPGGRLIPGIAPNWLPGQPKGPRYMTPPASPPVLLWGVTVMMGTQQPIMMQPR